MLTINFSSVNVRGVIGDLFSRNFHLQIGREERGVPLHPKVKMPDGRRQRKKTRLMDCEVAMNVHNVSQQRWMRTRHKIFEMLNKIKGIRKSAFLKCQNYFSIIAFLVSIYNQIISSLQIIPFPVWSLGFYKKTLGAGERLTMI